MADSRNRFLRSLLATSPLADVVNERVRRRNALIDAAVTADKQLLAAFDYLRSMTALAVRFDRAGADAITEAATPAIREHADGMAQLIRDRIQELADGRTPLMTGHAHSALIQRQTWLTGALSERTQSNQAAVDAAATAVEQLHATFRYLRSLTALVARFDKPGADAITEAATRAIREHADGMAQLIRSHSQELDGERTRP